MLTKKEIEDLQERLAAFSDNYYGEVAKKANISRATVVRFFESNSKATRKGTADAIVDAALAYIDEKESKQNLRMKKVRRLVYGEEEDQKAPGGNAVQGRLNLNS